MPASSLLELAERHRERLVGMARGVLGDAKDDAEDVVQEVLTCAASDGTEPRSPWAWLTTVTYRAAIDVRRRRERRERAHGRLDPPGTAESAAELAAEADEARRARAALEALADPYRAALRLRYLEGLSYPEIADRLDTLERTARTWVGRGLTQLRARLGGGE